MVGEASISDPDMSDDRVVRLLEELRDLQREHARDYREAVRQQRESIELQKAGLRRVRWILGAAALVLILAVVMLIGILVRVLPWLR